MPFLQLMLSSALAGTICTGLFAAAWVAYFWGDGDGERALFCTAVEVFALPLLVGSVQALRGQRSGLSLLRFGSVLFIAHPWALVAIWRLDRDPEYLSRLSGSG